MLEKLSQRRDVLHAQKRDIDNALADLERLATNAEAALQEIRSSQRKLSHG
jgi:ABC-type transporter Mla subunit MlaD